MVVGGDAGSAALMYTDIAAAGISGVTPGSPQWLGYAGLVAIMTGACRLVFRLLGVARDIRLLVAGADQLLVEQGEPDGLVTEIGRADFYPDVPSALAAARGAH